jgi:ribosomal protein S12 methylthiotransferase
VKGTFHLVGLGCPKNKVDAEVIWAGLAQAGLRAVDDPAEAEVIVINTCAFVQAAVEEALDTIVELAQYKQQGRCKTLVVAGCLPARYQDELVAELTEVDLFIGPGEVGDLPSRLGRIGADGGRLQVQTGQSFLPDADTPRANSLSPGAAYLKVAEGCSRRCSFCIIPSLRGPQRSRPLADLVTEAEALVRWGVSEVVLVAQDLAAWGRDLDGRPGLPSLVEALAGVPGLWWLRLMYLYPTEVTEELLRVMADQETVLPYLDVPLQHVDAGVLAGMRRQGDPDQALELVGRIRAALPGAVLRTSLMTGFPGETEAAFGRLEAFVAEARFERLGVFAFSAEEGTAAAGLDQQVPAELAAERRERLLAAQRPIAEAYHRSLIGQTAEVLVEAAQADGRLEGRCWNQAPEVDGATFLQGEAILGEVVRARLTDADAYDLEGEILA